MSQFEPLPAAFDLLDFWWAAGPAAWFNVDPEFDQACARFRPLRDKAARGDLDDWAETPHTALALLLLLDQIPRNLFRNEAEAFATDGHALQVAEAAIARGFDKAYPMPARNFFYLPLMHSEDLAVQERSLDIYRTAGDQDVYFYALVHHDAIRRFGRFPHRNDCLGRTTTDAERAYLENGGFAA